MTSVVCQVSVGLRPAKPSRGNRCPCNAEHTHQREAWWATVLGHSERLMNTIPQNKTLKENLKPHWVKWYAKSVGADDYDIKPWQVQSIPQLVRLAAVAVNVPLMTYLIWASKNFAFVISNFNSSSSISQHHSEVVARDSRVSCFCSGWTRAFEVLTVGIDIWTVKNH